MSVDRMERLYIYLCIVLIFCLSSVTVHGASDRSLSLRHDLCVCACIIMEKVHWKFWHFFSMISVSTRPHMDCKCSYQHMRAHTGMSDLDWNSFQSVVLRAWHHVQDALGAFIHTLTHEVYPELKTRFFHAAWFCINESLLNENWSHF